MLRVLGVLVCLLSSGCGIGLNFWQDAVVQVNVPAGPTTFSQAQTIQMSTDGNGPGKLTALHIPEVRIRIDHVSPGNKARSVTGAILISDASDPSFAPVRLPFQGLAVAEGTEKVVYPDGAAINRLQPAVLAKHPLRIEHQTTLSALPAQFQLTSSIHVLADVEL